MAERFTYYYPSQIIKDKQTGERHYGNKPLTDLLNELYEENQSSKEFIEQLQEELVLFKKAGADMGNDLNVQITALKQENEELKQQLNAFKPIIFEDVNNGGSSILYEKVD